MPYRKVKLIDNNIYHIFTRSIYKFKIFNFFDDYKRMLNLFRFYVYKDTPCKFSAYLKLVRKEKYEIKFSGEKIVKIIAYCIMPTHIHLVLEQLENNGISRYMNLILKSYTKYFNLKHKRKGPLWESRFKSVLVESDEQLLHLTRYVHLNPVSSYLVNKPELWQYSSYLEYIKSFSAKNITEFYDYIELKGEKYKKFTEDNIDYQRTLNKIKNLLIDASY